MISTASGIRSGQHTLRQNGENNMGTGLSKVRERLESVIAHILRNRAPYWIGVTLVILAGGWVWALLAGSGRGIFVMIIAVIVGILVILRIVRGPMDPSIDRSMPPMPDESTLSPRVKRVAVNGEPIFLVSREHPIALWKEFLAIVLAQGALILFVSQGSWKLGIAAWLALMGWACWHLADWWYATKVCVTDKRVFVTSGLIASRDGQMLLGKITDRSARYSILSLALAHLRIIDHQYVTVRFESAGQDQAINRIFYVPDGYEFNRLITYLSRQ